MATARRAGQGWRPAGRQLPACSTARCSSTIAPAVLSIFFTRRIRGFRYLSAPLWNLTTGSRGPDPVLTVWKEADSNVLPQLELAKEAFRQQVPSFGSCWAAQIGIVAAGGRCVAHPFGREMGIARKIELTAEGRAHPLYIGKTTVFDAFISHDDEITHLPPGALCLASNRYTRVQAVSITHQGGVMWAIQYHPEYDLHELARLMHCRTEKLIELGFFQNQPDAVRYIQRLESLHQSPDRKDLAWQLGIDADVMNPDARQIEVRNWIDHLVIPNRNN